MTPFFRFPHTPHLAWLAPGRARGDKVLRPEQLREFLSRDVVVEEKVDGANLGLAVDRDGALRAQNRGSYLDLEALLGQWKPLKRWLFDRRDRLTQALGQRLVLFGEWCYAVHSVRYTRLPDWLLVFDVYDREQATFWDSARRNALARGIGLHVVPQRAQGCFSLEMLTRMLDTSVLSDRLAEGLYLRRELGGRLVARAKLVRAEFMQSTEPHWSKRRLAANQLAATPGGAEP